MFCAFTLALIIIIIIIIVIAAHVVDCVRQYLSLCMSWRLSYAAYSPSNTILHRTERECSYFHCIGCYKNTCRFEQIFVYGLFNNALKNSYHNVEWWNGYQK
jgi:hypothetical protein